ncbi:DUF1836 domain-containing protein [Neobacillus sp. D3-1R]|uniref:DUF1836 domain-containing protein n=1 Tax=Neobacillus sp. D3-1R TaxID=3445778 RepID=UPI003FA0755E
MERFQLSRKNMADFLLSLKGEGDKRPLTIIQNAWIKNKQETEQGSLLSFIQTEMPPIFEKIIKADGRQTIGFSINDIVSLGNQIEFTNLSSTTIQNWVKRDLKGLIGSPRLGKKYTVEQAATLFIVEDLKTSLDFVSIRNVLELIFNNPDDQSDDIVDPIRFYMAYASVFEKIHYLRSMTQTSTVSLNQQLEQMIYNETLVELETFYELDVEHKETVFKVLVVASLTVLSAYYQTRSKKQLSHLFMLKEGFNRE